MKSLKKMTAVTVALCMLMATVPFDKAFAKSAASGEVKENAPLDVKITVTERNGEEVNGFFFRRGIALEKGKLYNAEDVCIQENGKTIVSDAEILQTYDDQSAAWVLVSGKVDLKPNECKNLTVTYGKKEEPKIRYVQNSDTMRVYAEDIEMAFGSRGIESIKYRGEEMLNGIPINEYVTLNGKTDYLSVTEISVWKETKSYSKFRLKGRLNDKVSGEITVMLEEGVPRIQIDHRITAEDNLMISGTGLTLGVKYDNAQAGSVIDEDFLECEKMSLSTYDNTRFNGAANVAEKTGYVIKENTIDFAPLVNGKEFEYYDGISRTQHLYISFDKGARSWAKTLSKPPSVKVDGEQYVKAGQIKNTYVSSIVKECMDTIKFGYEKSIGVFSAGVLPHEINRDREIVGRISTIPGELEYNYGLCYMQTGDEEIFRLMQDTAEARADICAYRGGRADLYGVLRGATTTDTYRFTIAHSYYGDQGGLYMAYMLTGDEWVEETLHLTTKKTLEDMYSMAPTGFGEHVFVYRTWSTGKSYPTGNVERYHESRGLIRVRTYYLMYQLTKDTRWLDAMNELLSWAKWAQKDSGVYPHFMYHNGDKYYDHATYEETIKDFVMLYGVRGINQLLDFTDNADALDITLKVADYLCQEKEDFGAILWSPISDYNIYSFMDGTGRGASPFTNMLAVDVLCTAFEKTNSDKYLCGVADFLEAFLAMEFAGIGADSFGSPYTAPRVSRSQVGDALRGTTALRYSDDISEIFLNNRERLIKLGYESLVLLFEEDARSCEDAKLLRHDFPDVIHNVYETDDTKAVFLSNVCADDWDGYREWDKTTQIEFEENRLWQAEKGVTNVIKDNKSVILEKFLKFPDYYSALQIPIYVEQFSGNARAEVITYSEEKTEIEFDGTFDMGLRIDDGKFPVNDEDTYDVSLTYAGGKVKLTVTKGGNVKPQNSQINILFDSKGNSLEVVGREALAKAGLGNVGAKEPLSSEKLKEFIKQSFGYEAKFDSAFPTWEEFGKVLLPQIAEKKKSVLDNAGIKTVYDARGEDSVSDEEAVTYGAEALEVLYAGEKLCSDVYLAKESLYGTKVEWKCNREDIMSGDGVLTRANVDCDSINLTATVTKNSAVKTRSFVIPIKKMTVPTAKQGSGFTDETAFPLIAHKTEFEVTFTAIPYENGINSTMGFTSSEVGARQNSDLPFIVRFNPSGVIDMYDTYTYTKGAIPYEANKTYYFRVVMRPDELTYDAYVRPEGGEEVVIGENCGARQSALLIDKVDKMFTWAEVDNCYTVKDISVIQPDDAKEEPLNNSYYDENGLVFGKYRFEKASVFPQVSDKGFILNWTDGGVYRADMGGYLHLYLGTESKRSSSLTLTELLKEKGLLDNNVTEESNVTAASLSRILVAMDINE